MNLPTKIAILGVGLIGGSIAMALKQRLGDEITIFGACSTSKRAKLAVERGIIDIALASPQNTPHDIGLTILSAPISTNLKLLKSLKLPHSLVIDVSSTKEVLYKVASQNIRFIGTHPMAGSEQIGFENADPNLFVDKPWIICERHHAKEADEQTVENLIFVLGGKPIRETAKRHDELVGLISHLPLMVSQTLLSTTQRQKSWKEAKLVASTGFRDITRLAKHSISLKQDIIMTNKKNILKYLTAFEDELDMQIATIRKTKSL